MKKILTVLLASLLSISAQASESWSGLGIGIIAGSPTGVTFKNWTSETTAIDLSAEWTTSSNDQFHIHADHLIHDFNMIKADGIAGSLALYYGYGGVIKLNEGKKKDTVLGIRVPVGLSLLLNKQPVELFIEVAPTLEVVPDTKLNVNAAIGGRFYF